MKFSELVVYIWLLPVVLQILIPLFFGIVWIVILRPLSVLLREVRVYFRKPDQQFARQEKRIHISLLLVSGGVTPLAPLFCPTLRPAITLTGDAASQGHFLPDHCRHRHQLHPRNRDQKFRAMGIGAFKGQLSTLIVAATPKSLLWYLKRAFQRHKQRNVWERNGKN